MRFFLRQLTLLTGSAATLMAGNAILPSLPQVAASFDIIPHAAFLVKLMATTHALFIALSAPFAGRLMDGYGRKPVLVISLLLCGVSGASGFFLDSLYAILVSRAILGVALAGIMAGFTTLIGDYYKGEALDRLMGLQAAVMGLGSVGFLLAGGGMALMGWRFTFLVYLLSFGICFCVIFFIDEPGSAPSLQGEDPPLDFKALAPIFGIGTLGMTLFYMIPVILPFYLQAAFGATSVQTGSAIAASLFFATLTALGFQKIKTLCSQTTIAGMTFFLMGVGHLFLSFSATFFQATAGSCICGLGFGLLIPNTNVWVVSKAPLKQRGRAIGGLSACLLLGQFLSPVVFSLFPDQWGGTFVFAVTGGVAVLCSAAGLVFRAQTVTKHPKRWG